MSNQRTNDKPARVEFVAPADADDILASEVAAMNAALADMARTAVKDLAGGDLAGDLVRSCLDVLAAETPRDMSRAVTGPMEARGDSAALVDLANNVALAARYLSVMAGYLVAGRFPEDVDTIEHFVDVVSTFGLVGSLERLADGAR